MKPRTKEEVEKMIAELGDFQAKQIKEDRLDDQIEMELSDYMSGFWATKGESNEGE